MKTKKTIVNIAGVTISNILSILSGIIVGFVLPKILSVEDYGMYKTFTLYSTYLGLFSFGIIDGIVLKYGGLNYSDLNKEKFRTLFSWYLVVHIIGILIFGMISMTSMDNSIGFMCYMLVLNMYAINVSGYFQQISQITQRFKEYSYRKILLAIIHIISVVVLYMLYIAGLIVNYYLYVCIFVLTNLVLSFWYIFTYRDIVIGNKQGFIQSFPEIRDLIRSGFPLLFANLASTLILTIDRQFVNLLFNKTDYAIYAFAYNMLSLVTVATSAVSTVLYPTLKRTNKDSLKTKYPSLIAVMLFIVYGALIVYFPLNVFISWFLPKYIHSLAIFRIIFPGLAISSSVTVIMHNYYKTLGANLTYFKKCIFILVISIIANGFAYKIFGSMESISIASIITMIIWYIIVEQYFVKKYEYNRYKNLIYLILMLITFYMITGINNIFLSCIVYIVTFIAISMLLIQSDIKSFYFKFINNK